MLSEPHGLTVGLTKSETPSSRPGTVRIAIRQPSPSPTSKFSNGAPKQAATAVLAFPTFASEISATRSPTEFAQANNVSPMIEEGIFQINPNAVNRPTTSLADRAQC